MTDAELYAELTGDPASVGYAAHVAIRDDGGIATLINDRSGPGSASIQLDFIPKDRMLAGLRPSIVALASAADAVQRKWDRILGTIQSAEWATVDATTFSLFTLAVSDGIATQEQVDAITHRPGSRAEALWGAGVAVPVDQISRTLNTQGA